MVLPVDYDTNIESEWSNPSKKHRVIFFFCL